MSEWASWDDVELYGTTCGAQTNWATSNTAQRYRLPPIRFCVPSQLRKKAERLFTSAPQLTSQLWHQGFVAPAFLICFLDPKETFSLPPYLYSCRG